ncbi:hypothetical protein [Sebaldella sp. S0638]|uniref:hypothetical protein n=1 Tax=Sebaldella sp. S0638 TaxID=2957809 RepID=UPI00209D5C1B|nr:hypothetical protein [Sebaldella sp. S0638]MCP1226777.1 hypothetical protein [Sebaldella sp. S0638]
MILYEIDEFCSINLDTIQLIVVDGSSLLFHATTQENIAIDDSLYWKKDFSTQEEAKLELKKLNSIFKCWEW